MWQGGNSGTYFDTTPVSSLGSPSCFGGAGRVWTMLGLKDLGTVKIATMLRLSEVAATQFKVNLG
jgi:hypothetical protein